LWLTVGLNLTRVDLWYRSFWHVMARLWRRFAGTWLLTRRIQHMLFWWFACGRHSLWHLKWEETLNGSQSAENFLRKCEETKERKLRMIFPVARHGRFFFLLFCFAFAICFHSSQFCLSDYETYVSYYQHRLDELLHKFFFDFDRPKQSIWGANNRTFYFYFFWFYWFSEFLCFSQHIL
jgi:hypothetical protein